MVADGDRSSLEPDATHPAALRDWIPPVRPHSLEMCARAEGPLEGDLSPHAAHVVQEANPRCARTPPDVHHGHDPVVRDVALGLNEQRPVALRLERRAEPALELHEAQNGGGVQPLFVGPASTTRPGGFMRPSPSAVWGREALRPRGATGATSRKMIKSTSSTSIKGVTLMSAFMAFTLLSLRSALGGEGDFLHSGLSAACEDRGYDPVGHASIRLKQHSLRHPARTPGRDPLR